MELCISPGPIYQYYLGLIHKIEDTDEKTRGELRDFFFPSAGGGGGKENFL